MRVLIPLPARDYDPTEAGVSWRVLRDAGVDVVFATPDGKPATADPVMVTGIGLDFWSRVPFLRHLKLIGLVLRANATGRAAYAAMLRDRAYQSPLTWSAAEKQTFDGLLLPGGHAQGMREYLESGILQRIVATFFSSDRPVGAICHGVVLVARSRSDDGRSVLHGRRTTALPWSFERAADRLAFARFWDRHYYRTYPEAAGEPAGHRSVQAEVTRALAAADDFVEPGDFRRASGLFRDTPHDHRAGFVARSGNYVSARWPGDAHAFAAEFVATLKRGRGADVADDVRRPRQIS